MINSKADQCKSKGEGRREEEGEGGRERREENGTMNRSRWQNQLTLWRSRSPFQSRILSVLQMTNATRLTSVIYGPAERRKRSEGKSKGEGRREEEGEGGRERREENGTMNRSRWQNQLTLWRSRSPFQSRILSVLQMTNATRLTSVIYGPAERRKRSEGRQSKCGGEGKRTERQITDFSLGLPSIAPHLSKC